MKYLALLLVYLFVAVKNSHAYLDPGTGSYILQVVVGSLLAGGYFFKDALGRFFKKTTGFFKKVSKK
ncbi:hypothetical protein A3F34_01240 [Candidatus Roizmanbacteria bacterium RIFCSPHIGHO2_12_FULL_44_10]|uniref:Uncharacterized protein n=1 Tax=Candidatus Roizmanbacteria bacterium RIFCSPHIGHO2_12_FULL_44_10 TaxID=1802054 RepID=A0A1F7I5A6_9BACT|nr:MAG: hypothetical protein A3F34_01240 [Candidatus Roizmanbacteria bacterium RIFCSPHIGHO2_12_FULL_44_10]